MFAPPSPRAKRSAALIGSPDLIARVYGAGRREKIALQTALFPHDLTRQNLPDFAGKLDEIEVLFSTWGMWSPSESELDLFPKLRAIFYAAGTVQGFARPFLEREIEVFSAWGANAVPVAQWTIAQILLANKGFHRNAREFTRTRSRNGVFVGRGNFGATVCILGAGQIGRLVCDYLRPFELDVAVFDPFLEESQIAKLGARKIETLEEAFSVGAVVSNHIANLSATKGLLRGELFEKMPLNATFINTGRGATVRESELIAVLQNRADLVALLDVTDPEPPHADSPLWDMENVVLTSHIAGSVGDEVWRMADWMSEEFAKWDAGEPTRWGVSIPMLETMA